MNKIQLLIILLSLFVASCTNNSEPLSIETGVTKSLASYRHKNISKLEYNLSFDIPESKTETIPGKNIMSFELKDNKQDLQIDFREDAKLLSLVICNGKRSAYRFESEHVVIPKEELQIGKNTIEFEFITGNTSLNRNDEFLYTLFVPDRARTAFPCFDQPDLKARFQLKMSVPNNWKAIANGKIQSVKEDGNKTLYLFQKTKALPTYLFSFVAGKFETITRERKGQKHVMYHRETDKEKLDNNTDEIFRLLFQSLDWLEAYTGVSYPFAKYDIVVIPSFQYGGMEHTGATLYNASRMFLDKNASKNSILARTNLIAHETAHMWFGDLVTMKWFDQVWLKEVFANFLADKISNPSFPDMNHKLKFQMAHFPSSYGVDRTSGANPINQQLNNLKDAGTVYGSIIYHKSPIVMNMLENCIGDDALQEGLRRYIKEYAYGNASWEDLISILDELHPNDLKAWSKVWVDQPGRPHITLDIQSSANRISTFNVLQKDVNGADGNWNQDINLILGYEDSTKIIKASIQQATTPLPGAIGMDIPKYIIPNGNGDAYAYFELDNISKSYLLTNISRISDDLVRGIAWINLYENLREGQVSGVEFVQTILNNLDIENNSLILERMLSYLKSSYWLDLSSDERKKCNKDLEKKLWIRLHTEENQAKKAPLFSALTEIAESSDQLNQLYKGWKDEVSIGGFSLSETKATSLACNLAVKMPQKAKELIETQIERIKNPDRKKKMIFMAPALSADEQVRTNFFASLKKAENREIERWVLDGLLYLNHPLREKEALYRLPQALALLKEIQETGDIFFPYNWLIRSYNGLRSEKAGDVTLQFLEEHPAFPENLKLKILQAGDLVIRKVK